DGGDCEVGRGGEREERADVDHLYEVDGAYATTSGEGYSTLPILFTASASFCASRSQKALNCGASRYWIGVSSFASDDWNTGSATAARAASRSFAITGSGVPAGAK